MCAGRNSWRGLESIDSTSCVGPEALGKGKLKGAVKMKWRRRKVCARCCLLVLMSVSDAVVGCIPEMGAHKPRARKKEKKMKNKLMLSQWLKEVQYHYE